jgi:hypothetical protein
MRTASFALLTCLTAACGNPDASPTQAGADAALAGGGDTQGSDGANADSGIGDSATADSGAADAADATPTDASSAPTFHAIWTGPMAANGCANKFCHGAPASPPGTLSMPSEAVAYDSLVNHAVHAAKCDATVRVLPGNHAKSLMWQKVAPGVTVCEGKMPDGTAGLTQAEADLIAAWIDAGALK